jgi:hypothetical protein
MFSVDGGGVDSVPGEQEANSRIKITQINRTFVMEFFIISLLLPFHCNCENLLMPSIFS